MSYQQYRPSGYSMLPPVIKNLMILNGLFFLAKITFAISFNIDLDTLLGLHFPTASDFRIWQPVTYLFMHGDFWHLALNMFALWMFGVALENYWGSKRFLTYYLITGFGAAIIHYTVLYFTQLQPMLIPLDEVINNTNAANVSNFINAHKDWLSSYAQDTDQVNYINKQLDAMMLNPGNTQATQAVTDFFYGFRGYFLSKSSLIIGASGSVFGILLGFGMLFPNTPLYLYFFFPIKAKYVVIGYGLIELFSGLQNNPMDNVAHFAHLGGMLFGFILIKYWNKTMRNRMY